MILAEKKLPDGRWACLNEPREGARVSVELADGVGGFDSFTFDGKDDARRVLDALPTAELREGPFPATDAVPEA